MADKTNFTTEQKLIIAAIVIGVGYFALFNPNTFSWTVDASEENTVQVYPDSDNVKNYELPVDMEITEHSKGWWRLDHYEYDISRVTFPNDGYLEFSDCVATDSQLITCADQDGESWGIKVLTTPDKPESDYSSDY